MDEKPTKPAPETDVVRIRANLSECKELATAILNTANKLHSQEKQTESLTERESFDEIGPEFIDLTAEIYRVLDRALNTLQEFC